jgi:hypothetical protein
MFPPISIIFHNFATSNMDDAEQFKGNAIVGWQDVYGLVFVDSVPDATDYPSSIVILKSGKALPHVVGNSLTASRPVGTPGGYNYFFVIDVGVQHQTLLYHGIRFFLP